MLEELKKYIDNTPKEKLLKETESLRNNIVNSNDIKVSDFLKNSKKYLKNVNKIINKMDIKSGCGYPASSLSNFAGHFFIIDDIECYSMEGFLQSLKFKNPEMQKEVCKLIGKAAKFKGKGKKWYTKQILYWKGVEIKRDSKEYQLLLNKAYTAMFEQSDSFKQALLATGNSTITHSIGKNKQNETVLTNTEFCGRLMKLRDLGKL